MISFQERISDEGKWRHKKSDETKRKESKRYTKTIINRNEILEQHSHVDSFLLFFFLFSLFYILQFDVQDGNTFGFIFIFENSNELLRQLKHIVSQRNHNKLCILGSFLNVVGNN